MGYFETVCQLCGVSPAIARIRAPFEPHSSAWSYSGDGFVDVYDDSTLCGPGSGCTKAPREEAGQTVDEHVAGPGCVSNQGYCGYRIGVEEMKGCRALQCLMLKESVKGWKEEDDDQEFEKTGKYFLTGCGDGSPDEGPLIDIHPVRHGVTETWPFNTMDAGEDAALPFHPTCFEIFKLICKDRLRNVDVHGLWSWRTICGDYESFEAFPRAPAVSNGREQWWWHEPGNEFLAANPVEIPGLKLLLQSCHQENMMHEGQAIPYDINKGALEFVYQKPAAVSVVGESTPPATSSSSVDQFMKLSNELLYSIMKELSSKDVANLRLVTPAFRQLPTVFFRELILKELPWLFEARDLPVGTTNWFKLWNNTKFAWGELKGMKNRKRIWKDVNEVVTRIEQYREEGKVTDD